MNNLLQSYSFASKMRDQLIVCFLCTLCVLCQTGVTISDKQPNNTAGINPSKFQCICYPCQSEYCSTNIACYSSAMKQDDGSGKNKKGCIVTVYHQSMQCHRSLGMFCCTGNLCNMNITPTIAPKTSDKFVPGSEQQIDVTFMVLSTCLPIAVLIICLVIVYVGFLRHKKRYLQRRMSENEHSISHLEHLLSREGSGLNELYDHSSGSGSGLPLLVQRTVARETQLLKLVGKGRYGEVWKATYHGEYVAVKSFNSRDEASWKRETEIYNTVMLRHDNILGFIAADVHFKDSITCMWLITSYHENGSLYEFLHRTTFDAGMMCRLALSAASGLAHLHVEIFGTSGKPGIAHRDIKTKNILVKSDHTCTIADLGLAVLRYQEKDTVDIAENRRVGTKRYMAPEILDNSLDMKCFDSFKKADMYAFGLVLWEITRRCVAGGIAEEYQPPYYDMIQQDPSFDEMKRVVVTEKRRPSIPNRWAGDAALQDMVKLIKECWHANPSVRLTSLRVMKSLSKLMDTLRPRKESVSGDSAVVADVNINIET